MQRRLTEVALEPEAVRGAAGHAHVHPRRVHVLHLLERGPRGHQERGLDLAVRLCEAYHLRPLRLRAEASDIIPVCVGIGRQQRRVLVGDELQRKREVLGEPVSEVGNDALVGGSVGGSVGREVWALGAEQEVAQVDAHAEHAVRSER
jgi:hypothetical protein